MDEATVESQLRRSVELVVPRGDPVLLAVSGGSDSMALLAAAAQVVPGRVTVVHVRHGLRAEAEAEAELVRQVCVEFGLPFRCVDAQPRPARPGRSETSARARRLEALTGVARAAGVPWVLTAHHADDALETLALHLLRGHRGDRAMAGIPSLRTLASGVQVLRPFLCTRHPPGRDLLARYREALGVPHLHDGSNDDLRIPRNAVRVALAGARGPLSRANLLAARRRAQRRLERRVGRIAVLLAEQLEPEGQGVHLGRVALRAGDDDEPLEHLAELLRLLGACLARPRRLATSRGLLERVSRALPQEHGRLVLPGQPTPLGARLSAAGWHLPGEELAPGAGAARVLLALGTESLFLGAPGPVPALP